MGRRCCPDTRTYAHNAADLSPCSSRRQILLLCARFDDSFCRTGGRA